MCIWCKVKTSVVLEIHNKIEMKRTVKYKLGKGFALNIRVKPFYIVKVSSSVSRSLIRLIDKVLPFHLACDQLHILTYL